MTNGGPEQRARCRAILVLTAGLLLAGPFIGPRMSFLTPPMKGWGASKETILAFVPCTFDGFWTIESSRAGSGQGEYFEVVVWSAKPPRMNPAASAARWTESSPGEFQFVASKLNLPLNVKILSERSAALMVVRNAQQWVHHVCEVHTNNGWYTSFRMRRL